MIKDANRDYNKIEHLELGYGIYKAVERVLGKEFEINNDEDIYIKRRLIAERCFKREFW